MFKVGSLSGELAFPTKTTITIKYQLKEVMLNTRQGWIYTYLNILKDTVVLVTLLKLLIGNGSWYKPRYKYKNSQTKTDQLTQKSWLIRRLSSKKLNN